jgi:DnaJ-class molecular chaperone
MGWRFSDISTGSTRIPVEMTDDYYEVLQVSTSAEPETIDRVYRLLAARFHPDNQQTGDESRFRILLEAYTVLRDPEKRARYEVMHQQHRRDRWRLVASGAQSENDFEMEQVVRLGARGSLYSTAFGADERGNFLGRIRSINRQAAGAP